MGTETRKVTTGKTKRKTTTTGKTAVTRKTATTFNGASKHPGRECGCEICKNELPFEMPAEVVDACANGRLVVFSGAGISTESRIVLQKTFYECIAEELGEKDITKSFPDLMHDYAEVKGRRLLLQRIKERLDYIEAFPELHGAAIRFHCELATLFYISDIVTTNWDPYFEQETGALPLVTDKDFALWDMPGRKVFKIHGSVYNLGSIVATSEDYARCYRDLNRSVLGATLKHLLATKTILFVGYSFGDSDFNRIYRFIASKMSDVLPSSYVVTLDDPDPSVTRGAHVIKTDAAFFLRTLKSQLLSRGCLLDDERWRTIPVKLFELISSREELYETVDPRRLPAAVLCGCYQDGLIHAFERMLEQRRTGEYSHIQKVEKMIHDYEERRMQLAAAKRYYDAAYALGYKNGLMFLIASDAARKKMASYFVYGSPEELRSLTAFKRVAKNAETLHRQAYAQARQIAQKASPGNIFHHRPVL